SEIAVSDRFAIGMTECSLPAVDTDVLVIGAGPGGLAASQQLKQRGVPHKVLERGDTVGHTWANLYDSLVLHTGKRMSSLPGLAFPADYPTFVSRGDFLSYLRRYRDTFDLPVETGVRVDRLERTNGTWTARTSKGAVTSRAVVMATGIVANPVAPRFPGQDQFQGRVMHSVEYRRPDPFRGQRVLVVGVGNSGGEIGAELAHHGVLVTMAVRSGANVVPRQLLGIPIQYVAYYVRKLPRPAQRVIVSLVRQITILRRGPPVLPPSPVFALDAVPLIGFHLVDAIKAGTAHVRPGLQEFTAKGVRFADGREEAFDTVILATGFHAALAPLGTLVTTDAKGFARRADRVTSADQTGLFFVGSNYDSGGGLLNIGIDAKLVGRILAQS
ncbi:MAG TPA: NAD(P)/FAD-dependent oxidoreductase, partial [Gemmatimonadales bacterium]|nr:NAD(P)/FAD-dependent oxidoreductase [Gemmatimonadales bacterium]